MITLAITKTTIVAEIIVMEVIITLKKIDC